LAEWVFDDSCLLFYDLQEWIREETVNSNLTDKEAFEKIKISDLLDYNETLLKRAKEEKSRIDYDEQLAQVIRQYESRLVRIVRV
jgi:hypothetical protein